MFTISQDTKIHVYLEPVDMRKSVNGLGIMSTLPLAVVALG